MDAIFTRVSVRSFESRPVEEAKIEQILRAAMAAPSAMNQQPWEFYVIRDKEKLQQMAMASPYAVPAMKAPVAIVPCYSDHRLQAAAYKEIDLSIACENLLLEAEVQGLGAVWLGIAPVAERMEKVASILNLPAELHAFAIIPLGYPVGKGVPLNRYDSSRIHWD